MSISTTQEQIETLKDQLRIVENSSTYDLKGMQYSYCKYDIPMKGLWFRRVFQAVVMSVSHICLYKYLNFFLFL